MIVTVREFLDMSLLCGRDGPIPWTTRWRDNIWLRRNGPNPWAPSWRYNIWCRWDGPNPRAPRCRDIISCRGKGPTPWPPKYPVVRSLDLFLRGYVKDIVYKTLVPSLTRWPKAQNEKTLAIIYDPVEKKRHIDRLNRANIKIHTKPLNRPQFQLQGSIFQCNWYLTVGSLDFCVVWHRWMNFHAGNLTR